MSKALARFTLNGVNYMWRQLSRDSRVRALRGPQRDICLLSIKAATRSQMNDLKDALDCEMMVVRPRHWLVEALRQRITELA